MNIDLTTALRALNTESVQPTRTEVPHGGARYATAEDFAAWEVRARVSEVIVLIYVIQDCVEASIAMRGHNPVKEGFYSDQAAVYRCELIRRGVQISI